MADCQKNPEQEKALQRLRCAHCQSLINGESLARAVLDELRRNFRVDFRRRGGGPKVSDPELIEAAREGIDRFLSASLDEAA
jgi:hypothetical protein